VGTDFITGLPMTDSGHDTILVFVDHTTKMVHFVPTTKTCNAVEFATHFVDTVIRLHGVPERILSDRDERFVNEFMSEVTSQIGTRHNLSTSFHPQTGGQHERVNRVLEEMLRHYVSVDHSDWDTHLSMAEFAINNSVSASTGATPFFLNQGYHPRTPLSEGVHRNNDRVPVARAFVSTMHERIAHAKKSLQRAQDRQKHYADKGRSELTFQVGDEVMLSTKNIKLKKGDTGVRKLLPVWIGPFEVSAAIGSVAYKLQLPPSLRIHDVFHVSLLKPYHPGGSVQPPPPLLLHDGSDENIFEVECILSHRERKYRHRTKKQFLIAWKGYGPEHHTWEPEENLDGCPEALQDYWNAVERRKKASTSSASRTTRSNARGKR
jgi:hypothetical protein